MKKRIIIIIFLILLFGVGDLVYMGQKERLDEELYYSGTIEAKQADISFQISGRVVEIFVDEGQSVKKDQELALLDQAELKALYEQAKANLDKSIRNLRQLELSLSINEDILPIEVEKAEAGIKALKAQLEMMESGYRRQEIDRAELALQSLSTSLEQARKDKERYDILGDAVSQKERENIDLQYEKILREYEQSKKNLDQLKEGFRKEEILTAKAKLSEGTAGLALARANLRKIELYKEDVAAAQTVVKFNRAALDLAETQLDYSLLKASFDGIITSRNMEPGEVISSGQEVLSIADLSTVDLKIFVPETEIGNVKPDQKVEIRVDSLPDKTFTGRVSFISSEAEFTPKIIQTHKERVKLVYLVKILIPNPDIDLKPGMPADAWLR